jgi:pentatricopeptide repeat protein
MLVLPIKSLVLLTKIPFLPVEYFEDFYTTEDYAPVTLSAPDAVSYAYLIKAHSVLGNVEEAFEALAECKAKGITPLNLSYALLLDLCSKDPQLRDRGLGVISEAETHYEKSIPFYSSDVLSLRPKDTKEVAIPEEAEEGEEGEDGEKEKLRLVAQEKRYDIEWVNSKIYFFGIEDAREAERV